MTQLEQQALDIAIKSLWPFTLKEWRRLSRSTCETYGTMCVEIEARRALGEDYGHLLQVYHETLAILREDELKLRQKDKPYDATEP